MTVYEKIGTEEMKKFAKEVINGHSKSGSVSETAEKAVEILHGLLEERDLIQQHGNQMFVDILTCAAIIHDVFPVKECWTESFTFRKELMNLASKEYEMPEPICNSLFETLEAQLGNRMPITKCRPQPGTPQDLFATAIWVASRT